MNIRTQSSQKKVEIFAKQTHQRSPTTSLIYLRSIITKAIRTQMGQSLFTTNDAIYDSSINQIAKFKKVCYCGKSCTPNRIFTFFSSSGMFFSQFH